MLSVTLALTMVPPGISTCVVGVKSLPTCPTQVLWSLRLVLPIQSPVVLPSLQHLQVDPRNAANTRGFGVTSEGEGSRHDLQQFTASVLACKCTLRVQAAVVLVALELEASRSMHLEA